MKLSLVKLLEAFEPTSLTVHISENHGHKMTVSSDDVTLGEQRRYDIRGAADHPHVVDITVDDFVRLSSGESVVLESSSDAGHGHQVKIVSKPFRRDHSNPEQLRNPLIPVDSADRKKGY